MVRPLLAPDSARRERAQMLHTTLHPSVCDSDTHGHMHSQTCAFSDANVRTRWFGAPADGVNHRGTADGGVVGARLDVHTQGVDIVAWRCRTGRRGGYGSAAVEICATSHSKNRSQIYCVRQYPSRGAVALHNPDCTCSLRG
jgi:hypothetical protein